MLGLFRLRRRNPSSLADQDDRPRRGSAASHALAAAGDSDSAHDVASFDSVAQGVERKLRRGQRGLVERLIYGPQPAVAELQSGGRLASKIVAEKQPIIEAALGRLASGEAFMADGKLADRLRRAVANNNAYGFTVPVELGGAGASYIELAHIEESLTANGLGALAVELSGELTIGASSILAYGTESQRKTFLPMLCQGTLLGFALTEVGVGINAKKIQAYVEQDVEGDYRLFASGAQSKLWITNATHGGLLGVVARVGSEGEDIGLFVVQLPDRDIVGPEVDYEFRCEPSGVAAFAANHNSHLHFHNFPIPHGNRIPADGVEVLFYCLRLGRCMLAAMSAGYQRMLARDASFYAIRRVGIGGPIIRHELPRLALGQIVGGALLARSLVFLALKQDEDEVDLRGLRDLTKSAAAQAGLESMVACEHVMGGRSFDKQSRVNEARVNLHLFGVVEGEDDMIRMGMVSDVTERFVNRYLAAMLGVIDYVNKDQKYRKNVQSDRLLRIGVKELRRVPGRCTKALGLLAMKQEAWRLALWIVKNATSDIACVPIRIVPTALLPRYRSMPKRLAVLVRFAERELRRLRWAYLRLSLVFQLELTRAQIPLLRFGLCIEYLVSMLVVCHHASLQDKTQQTIAELQAHLLRRKFESVKIPWSMRELNTLRRIVATVGDDIEDDRSTLLNDLAAEPFAHPWD